LAMFGRHSSFLNSLTLTNRLSINIFVGSLLINLLSLLSSIFGLLLLAVFFIYESLNLLFQSFIFMLLSFFYLSNYSSSIIIHPSCYLPRLLSIFIDWLCLGATVVFFVYESLNLLFQSFIFIRGSSLVYLSFIMQSISSLSFAMLYFIPVIFTMGFLPCIFMLLSFFYLSYSTGYFKVYFMGFSLAIRRPFLMSLKCSSSFPQYFFRAFIPHIPNNGIYGSLSCLYHQFLKPNHYHVVFMAFFVIHCYRCFISRFSI